MLIYYLNSLKDLFLDNMKLVCIILLVVYLIKTIVYFNLAKKTCPSKRWFAFFPIVRHFIFFMAINRSWVNIFLILFLLCIPVIGWISLLIIYILWNLELSSRFSDKIYLKFIAIFLHPICLIILAFSKIEFRKESI